MFPDLVLGGICAHTHKLNTNTHIHTRGVDQLMSTKLNLQISLCHNIVPPHFINQYERNCNIFFHETTQKLVVNQCTQKIPQNFDFMKNLQFSDPIIFHILLFHLFHLDKIEM